jgi:hypothetical protein
MVSQSSGEMLSHCGELLECVRELLIHMNIDQVSY